MGGTLSERGRGLRGVQSRRKACTAEFAGFQFVNPTYLTSQTPPAGDPGAGRPSLRSAGPRPLLPQTQGSRPPAPPPSDPGVPAPGPSSLRPRIQTPGPSLLRPRGPGPQPLPPQAQGSRPPAHPPSDPGVPSPLLSLHLYSWAVSSGDPMVFFRTKGTFKEVWTLGSPGGRGVSRWIGDRRGWISLSAPSLT